jgi:hypothetical protein
MVVGDIEAYFLRLAVEITKTNKKNGFKASFWIHGRHENKIITGWLYRH